MKRVAKRDFRKSIATLKKIKLEIGAPVLYDLLRGMDWTTEEKFAFLYPNFLLINIVRYLSYMMIHYGNVFFFNL